MIIALSGPQGCGKSTLLTALTERFDVPVVRRKSSRSILKDWDVTLDQVNSDLDLTVKFQDEIIHRKFNDERDAWSESENGVVLTERTYADLFTYALMTLGKYNQYSNWLDEYYEKCAELQRTIGTVLYIPSGIFNPVDDGVRAVNGNYQHVVNSAIGDFTVEMQHEDQRLEVISESSVEDRVEQVARMGICWDGGIR